MSSVSAESRRPDESNKKRRQLNHAIISSSELHSLTSLSLPASDLITLLIEKCVENGVDEHSTTFAVRAHKIARRCVNLIPKFIVRTVLKKN